MYCASPTLTVSLKAILKAAAQEHYILDESKVNVIFTSLFASSFYYSVKFNGIKVDSLYQSCINYINCDTLHWAHMYTVLYKASAIHTAWV